MTSMSPSFPFLLFCRLSIFATSVVFVYLTSVNACTPSRNEFSSPVFQQTAHAYIDEGPLNGSYIKFEQSKDLKVVYVSGKIKGLSSNSMHGFHIHEFGNLGNHCLNAGAHYNPFNRQHGAPTEYDRHVGDLGNIITDDHGVAVLKMSDEVIKLTGEFTIVGRSVVVHAKKDDLGRGGNEESKKTGNAGARLGCGIIVTKERSS